MTFADLKARVRRMANDIAAEVRYSDELLFDATVSGFAALLRWLPNEGTFDLVLDGATMVYPVTDANDDPVFMITGVYDNDARKFLQRSTITPGGSRGANEIDWMEYPISSVNFSSAPDASASLTVYSRFYWENPASPEDNDFEIPVPAIGIQGLVYFIMASILSQELMKTVYQRRFGDRQQDAGTPEDNPVKEAVRHYLDLFHLEMERMPKLVGKG